MRIHLQISQMVFINNKYPDKGSKQNLHQAYALHKSNKRRRIPWITKRTNAEDKNGIKLEKHRIIETMEAPCGLAKILDILPGKGKLCLLKVMSKVDQHH